MTFSEAVNTCLRVKYATFSGRASRSEYWWFALAVLLLYAVIAVIFVTFGLPLEIERSPLGLLAAIIGGAVFLATFLPSIAVNVRRFHDVNLSGWWVLAGLVLGALPVIGWIANIAMLVVEVLKGTTGDNRFGPDPLTAPDTGPFT